MKKALAVVALLALAACGKKAPAPAADTTSAAPAPADSMGMQHDSTMVRDSAHSL